MATIAVGCFGAFLAVAGVAEARRLAIRMRTAESTNMIRGEVLTDHDVDTMILIPQGQVTE